MQESYNESRTNKWNFIYSIFCFIYMFSFLYCLFSDSSYGDYKTLSLLPLTGFICLLLVRTNKRCINNLSILVINIVSLIRYALYPLAILINSSTIGKRYNDSESIHLMIYELIGVFVIIALFGNKLLLHEKSQYTLSEKSDYREETRIGIVTVGLLVLLPCLLILFPSLLVNKNSAGGVISWIYSMGEWSIVVTIFYVLGVIIGTEKNLLSRCVGLLASIVFAGYYVLSMTFGENSVNRWLIIAAGLSTAFVMLYFFPEYKRRIIAIVLVGIIASVFIGTFIKFKNTSISLTTFYTEYLSVNSLDAYFMGIEKINLGISMIDATPIAKSFQCTLTDFFGSVPLISKFFDASQIGTSALYLKYINRTDLICPTVVQSIAHFGKIGAPVIAMMFTYLSMYFNKKLNRANDPFRIFILVELVFYCSVFFGINMSIIMEHMWFRIFYLILLNFNIPVKLGRE